jgi:predicted enzyme related to lactoylglutathione lyase
VPTTVQPILVTRDLERLVGFYVGFLGATQTTRVPDDGPAFFIGLRLGDSDLGLVHNMDASTEGGRILLSIEVPDVDATLAGVTAAGGTVHGPPNDMPWGQRVAHIADPDGNPVNLTTTTTG